MLPVLSDVIVIVMIFVLWAVMRRDTRAGIWLFIFPLFIAVVFHILGRSLLADLVDEVWDNSQELIAIKVGHVDHMPLRDIVNISYSGFTNPKRVTLTLRQPGRWGKRIGFIPIRSSIRILDLDRNQMTEDLISRVDRARQT